MMTIEEFCDRHGAYPNLRAWALASCRDLPHAWETIRHDRLVWMATRPGVLDDRTLRRFAVWSARQVQHLMTDQRSLAALDVAERHAESNATDAELGAARAAAWYAARDASWVTCSVSRVATWDAAWAAWSAAGAKRHAARDAARSAARAAAWYAARDAADAVRAAAGEAAGEAAGAAQASWLRANAKPNWEAKP